MKAETCGNSEGSMLAVCLKEGEKDNSPSAARS